MYKLLSRLLFCLIALLFAYNHGAYALKPAKEYFAIPDTLHLPFEKNTITTPDGLKLASWTLLPAKERDNKTTLVLAYADAGNMSGWLSPAAILSQMGYTIVLFDYRGFGASDSFAMDARMLYYNEFATDLTAVVKFAKGKYPKNKTGIWCFSMGSIVATLSAKAAQPAFIIGDGFITDPLQLQLFYAKQKVTIGLPDGYKAYPQALADIKVPMLIFSGSNDKVATDASIKKLKTTKPALAIRQYKGGHMEAFGALSKDFFGSGYAAAINKFLKVK